VAIVCYDRYSSCLLANAGAVELRNKIADHFSVDLPATLAFDQPSLEAIAVYLTAMLGQPVDATPPVVIAEHGRQYSHAYTVTAVLGSSARFPAKSASLEGFWNAAERSADLQQEVPYSRWNIEDGYSPSVPPKSMTFYVRFGSFCEGKLWMVNAYINHVFCAAFLTVSLFCRRGLVRSRALQTISQ